MHKHEPETRNSNPDEQDSYDEFEERMTRIGILIRDIWCGLTMDQRVGHVVGVLTLLVLLIYTSYTIKMYRSNKIAADAAKAANVNATKALSISQRAYVTIGKPDGTVADIVWPHDPKGKAGIIVYFQNAGHIPAKFNWGPSSPIIAVMPKDPNIRAGDWGPEKDVIFKPERVFEPMWRARDPKQPGSVSWSGTVLIPGNSSYQGVLWEIPQERMRQLMEWDRMFVPDGKFDYCDGFGHRVCQKFGMVYMRSPYDRMILGYEDECSTWEMKVLNPNPKLEYLDPCELPKP